MKPATEFEVPPEQAGRRLDLFLAERLALSRRYVRRLLDRQGVRLAGKPAGGGAALRARDRIEVLPFRHPDQGIIPEPGLPIQLIREQEGLVFVDKPAGIAVHPLDFDETGTLANAMLGRNPELREVGEGGLRPGVVHRLDIETSGVLCFALREAAWRRAREAFEARRAEKTYQARIHGLLRDEREVELRLENRGRRVRVVARGGRRAVTLIRPLASAQQESLVEVRPVTGLRHQIRVTLAWLGHPVVGDRLYGSERSLGRHLLHATRLRIGDAEANSAVPAGFELRTR